MNEQSTGYNFSQYPSLEASNNEQTDKIQPFSCHYDNEQ